MGPSLLSAIAGAIAGAVGKHININFCIVGHFWAAPSRGMAKHGFSKIPAAQIKGRNRNPCSGGSYRGHFPFTGRIPKLEGKVYVYALVFSSRNGSSSRATSG